ncbi:MAG: NUDIX hydrolase [Candidatus Nanoarchaeia archaeon]
MTDELIDIFNAQNNNSKVAKMKSEAHKKGLWHRATHIWLYNSNGDLLLQLRAKEKSLYPDMWDVSVGGHVSAGEEPITSGIRELKEELGLKAREKDLVFFGIRKVNHIYKKINNKEFLYVYLLKYDGDIKKLKLQKEEVQKIKFFSQEELKKDVKNNPHKFLPHGTYWNEIMREVNHITKK